jgi:hypothetical protein
VIVGFEGQQGVIEVRGNDFGWGQANDTFRRIRFAAPQDDFRRSYDNASPPKYSR